MRFSDVSGVTMRSVDVDGLDIDSHDLFFGSLFINGSTYCRSWMPNSTGNFRPRAAKGADA